MRRSLAGPGSGSMNTSTWNAVVQVSSQATGNSSSSSPGVHLEINSITHQGLLNEHCYEIAEEQELVFNTSHSCAVIKDPFSGQWEYYFCLEMKSKLDGDGLNKYGGRPPMNFVIVLDISGSMSLSFHYNQGPSKIDVARQSLITLLQRLKGDDKLAIVLFDDRATTLVPLEYIKKLNMEKVRNKIQGIRASGSTDLGCGMKRATFLLENHYKATDESAKASSRIFFLTDMVPTAGDLNVLLTSTQNNANRNILTTFLGVGVDFGADLAFSLSNIKGCNYYSVNSAQEFQKQMVEDFDYTSLMICHDVSLRMNTENFVVEDVYGAPTIPNKEKDEFLRIESICPSPKTEYGIKGGVVLLKLKPTGSFVESLHIRLRLTYVDWEGKHFDREETIEIPPIPVDGKDYFQNKAVRKGVLLVRFANLMKAHIVDQIEGAPKPAMTLETGIFHHTSKTSFKYGPLDPKILEHYKQLTATFKTHFVEQMEIINDKSLQKELEKLQQFAGEAKPLIIPAATPPQFAGEAKPLVIPAEAPPQSSIPTIDLT